MARYARKLNTEPMDESRLKQIIQAEIHSATGSLLGSDGGGDLADRRREAMEFYLSEPFGNEVEGRSQAIDSVVHDTVEAALPPLLEIFSSSDEVVRFEPAKPSDEEHAKQATDYINYILNEDNDSFQLFYSWFKDALLQKNGIIKAWWEVNDKVERETMTGLTLDQVSTLLYDENGQPLENIEPIEKSLDEETGLIDITILRSPDQNGRVKIVGVPPEEFLIARRAVHEEEAPFLAHRDKKTISELIEAGFDPEVLERIPSYDEMEYNEERLARFEADDEWPIDANQMDPAMRSVWVYECYIKTDFDGDGVTELRMVTVAGPGYEILDNQPVDDIPFVSITPIPMPHKFFGMSLADETMDLQLIKSTILRQLLDNMYGVNNGRVAVNERVELDDLLVNRPDGVVRVEGDGPIGDSLQPLQTVAIGNFAFPLLEYMDGVKENRTGITRYNQGMDADSLNKTATGIDRIMSASQKRQQLIARIFAETGVKPLMKKVLRLVVKNQDKARMVRLRDEWVPMDPRVWNVGMDVKINVGLGHGTKEQEMAALTASAEMDAGIIALQGGANGPLITYEQIYNAKRRFLEAAGMRNVESYVKDPKDSEGEEKPPDPATIEAQMKAQAEQQKMQMEAEKLKQEDRHHQEEMELERQKLDLQVKLDAGKAVGEQDIRAREVKVKEDTLRGTSAGENLDRLERAENTVEQAARTLENAADSLNTFQDRLARIEEILTSPATITPIKQNGRIVGGVTERAGIKTTAMIQ